MKELTYGRARWLLLEVVDDAGPDYVYAGPQNALDQCAYRNADGSPACLIGHMFARDGIDLDEVNARMESADEGRVEGSRAGLVASYAYGFMEGEAELLIDAAQAHQDMGDPWGLALSKAVALVGER